MLWCRGGGIVVVSTCCYHLCKREHRVSPSFSSTFRLCHNHDRACTLVRGCEVRLASKAYAPSLPASATTARMCTSSRSPQASSLALPPSLDLSLLLLLSMLFTYTRTHTNLERGREAAVVGGAVERRQTAAMAVRRRRLQGAGLVREGRWGGGFP